MRLTAAIEETDRFALAVLARTQTAPLGAIPFLSGAQIYSHPHRGKFVDRQTWQQYLLTNFATTTRAVRQKSQVPSANQIGFGTSHSVQAHTSTAPASFNLKIAHAVGPAKLRRD